MGASGSGKTTLLNCIATIDALTAGRIAVEGKDVTRLHSRDLARFRRERLGFVFQDSNLLDTLTAFENITLALTIQKVPAGQVEARVKETARLLDITDCLEKYPYQMSGGQRQRTAVGAAGGGKVSLQHPQDFPYGICLRTAGQQITAPAPPDGTYQSGPGKPDHNLFQIFIGYLLTPGHIPQGDGPALTVQRQI